MLLNMSLTIDENICLTSTQTLKHTLIAINKQH